MANFLYTLRAVTEGEPGIDSDQLAAFRAELIRRREALGLTIADAASRTAASDGRGITAQRWAQIERGWETKGGGIRIPANPRRGNLVKMAKAVGWPVGEALELAGLVATMAESRWNSSDPREELYQLTASWSDSAVAALIQFVRVMRDPSAPAPDGGFPSPAVVDQVPCE